LPQIGRVIGYKNLSLEILSYDKCYRRVETACNFKVQTKLSESEPRKIIKYSQANPLQAHFNLTKCVSMLYCIIPN
jgi:hypothetical protein